MEEQKQKSEMHRRDAIIAYNLKMELKLRGVRQREKRREEERRKEERKTEESWEEESKGRRVGKKRVD